MSNMTMTPTPIVDAANAARDYYKDEDPQVFFSPDGAVVLTDYRAVEVYTYADGLIVQMRYLHTDGWEDITDYLK